MPNPFWRIEREGPRDNRTCSTGTVSTLDVNFLPKASVFRGISQPGMLFQNQSAYKLNDYVYSVSNHRTVLRY